MWKWRIQRYLSAIPPKRISLYSYEIHFQMGLIRRGPQLHVWPRASTNLGCRTCARSRMSIRIHPILVRLEADCGAEESSGISYGARRRNKISHRG